MRTCLAGSPSRGPRRSGCSGLALAALLARESFDCCEPSDQGGTFSGNALMAAVGLAVVKEVCRDAFRAGVRQRGKQLQRGLQALVREHGLMAERGAGLLRALLLPTDRAEAVVTAARELSPVGPLVNAPRPAVIRLMSALNITEAEIDEALGLLGRALRAA